MGFVDLEIVNSSGKPKLGRYDKIPKYWLSQSGCRDVGFPIRTGEEPIAYARGQKQYYELYDREAQLLESKLKFFKSEELEPYHLTIYEIREHLGITKRKKGLEHVGFHFNKEKKIDKIYDIRMTEEGREYLEKIKLQKRVAAVHKRLFGKQI